LLILDEVLNFINRHRGMAESFHAFIQNLTVATTGTTGAAAVISLPRSKVEMTDSDLLWQERITRVVRRVARDLFANDEAEISEVIRRRLFEEIGDERIRKRVARDYADWCFERRHQLPTEWMAVDSAATEAKAREFLRGRFEACYPFHPATLSVFQRKWRALSQYQQTRGTLAMMAQWISLCASRLSRSVQHHSTMPISGQSCSVSSVRPGSIRRSSLTSQASLAMRGRSTRTLRAHCAISTGGSAPRSCSSRRAARSIRSRTCRNCVLRLANRPTWTQRQSRRTLVLDSVYPPDPVPPRLTIHEAGRESFFRACAVDAAGCAASFPNLANTYAETLDRLRAKPLPVDLPPQLKQPDNRVILTTTLFGAVVGNLIYYPRNYPGLPRLIAAVHDGDTSGLGSIMEAMVVEAAGSDIADQTAVECRDRPHLRMPPAKDASPFDNEQKTGLAVPCFVAVGRAGMPASGRRAGAAGIDDEVAGIDIPAERLVSPDGNEGHGFGSPPAAQPGSLKQDGIIGLRDPVEGGGSALAPLGNRDRSCRCEGQEFTVLEGNPVGGEPDIPGDRHGRRADGFPRLRGSGERRGLSHKGAGEQRQQEPDRHRHSSLPGGCNGDAQRVPLPRGVVIPRTSCRSLKLTSRTLPLQRITAHFVIFTPLSGSRPREGDPSSRHSLSALQSLRAGKGLCVGHFLRAAGA